MATDLKTTTATVAVTADTTTGNVAPIVKLPDHMLVMQQAKQAFEDEANREKLAGSGVQRMGYVVMCECARGMIDGTMPFRIADAVTDANVRKTVAARMLVVLELEKPDTKALAQVIGSEEAAAAGKLFTSKEALVKRGVEVAAMLAAHGVSFTAFNTKLGVFAVFPAMLYPKTAEPTGRLRDDAAIALDGRSIVWSGKAQNGRALVGQGTASVAQLRSVCWPPATPRAPRAGAGVDNKDTAASADKLNPRNIASVVKHVPDPEILLGALHAILCAKDAPVTPLPRDTFTDASWNKESDLAQLFMRSRASWDANAASPKASAKRKVA